MSAKTWCLQMTSTPSRSLVIKLAFTGSTVAGGGKAAGGLSGSSEALALFFGANAES